MALDLNAAEKDTVAGGIGEFVEFFLSGPLYEARPRPSNGVLQTLLFHSAQKIDGYCPKCGRATTFTLGGGATQWSPSSPSLYPNESIFTCARNVAHSISVWLRIDKDSVQKVGQYPSLADVANDQSKTYRAVLSQQDMAEFHRAIGLAAHGVGIGAFVYLRRIFERLIHKRFREYQGDEGWDEKDFGPKMADKISLLKNHLPSFLVENRKIYGILSLGIHDLSEDQCRSFFPVLKASIEMILDEDSKKRAELKLKQDLQRAIQDFAAAPDDE